MSLAQKIALKKAQEASARARRGTGKPDEPKKLRPKAKDYLAKGREMAQRDGVQPGSSARKVRVASRANATGGGGRSGSDRTKFDPRSGNQTVTRFTPKQRAAAVRKAAGVNRPKPQTLSSTTGSDKRGKDTKFDDLSPSEKKKLSSIADIIRKINDDIVGSKNMTYTADALQTFDNSGDPYAPGNDQTLQDFIDGIDEAIAEMDDLWQGSPEERSARKKLTTLKGEVQSMMLVSDGKSTEPPRAKANAPKASGGSKSAMGTADPATMSVSAIVKERKELLAKKREGDLSKEEAARLVAIQAESSLRTKNRKEGKGAGPTKISMAKKDSSPARGDNPISDPEGKKREQRRKEMGYDKPAATDLKSMSITELLKMQNNRRTLPAVRKMIDQELNRRADEASGWKRETSGPWKSNEQKDSGESTKKKLASSVQVGDVIRRADGDREVVAVERKPDGSYRFTTRMKGNPGTGEFNADRNEQLDIIDSATRQNDANSKRLAEEAAKRRASDKPPTQAESDKSLEKRFDANLTALQKIADRLMRRDIFDRDRDPNQPDGIPYGVDPKTWTKKDAIQSAIEGLWYYIQEDREYGDNPEVSKIAKDLWEIEREVRGLTPKDIRTVDDQTLNTYARLGTTPEIRKLAQDEIDRRARMSGRR